MSILSLALSLVAGGSLPSCDLSNMALPSSATYACQTLEGDTLYLYRLGHDRSQQYGYDLTYLDGDRQMVAQGLVLPGPGGIARFSVRYTVERQEWEDGLEEEGQE